MICYLATHLFGRHVTDCSHHNAGIGDRSARRVFGTVLITLTASEFCQTEIENLNAVVCGDEQVLRLKVAMDNSFFMGSRQTADDLLGVLRHLAQRDWTRFQTFA